ncbi:MAG: glycyl-radical enzyme activating protein [Acidobacteriota bacterium]|jgi:pyruvate formate lyase activating enzyme|nr:glycyl-radical enzyme activating protein [Acidobacteriota bacterium]
MTETLTGKVYDIQGFSIQDGPGIRTTVFLKGCPLRCPWCHSPESQLFQAQLSWMAMRCLGVEKCGNCIPLCPKQAISPGKAVQHAVTGEDVRHVRVDRALCDNCGACTAGCHPKALAICGTDYTVEELVGRVSKDKPFYDHSGGGVTLSGGEPLCQPDFAVAFLGRLKECGIHTALDTTGYVPYEVFERALPHTDLFLYDLKHMKSDDHRIVTGVPNELILENARKLSRDGGRLQIRVPVIPHFNDSPEAIEATGAFCKSLGDAVEMVQLLPYHNLGVMKYQRIYDPEAGGKALEAAPPTEGEVAALKAILEGQGLPVTVH